MRKVTIISLAFILSLTSIPSAQTGAVPNLISYQGHLVDDQGDPLDGDYQMIFAIYDALTDGELKWTSSEQTVSVENGLFTYDLGSVAALPADLFGFGTTRYLSVTVSGEEIQPRTRLCTVPYSFYGEKAATAEQAYLAFWVECEGCISTEHILDGSIQLEDIGQNGATPGQSLQWNGSVWEPVDLGSGDITAVNAGNGLTGGGSFGDLTIEIDSGWVDAFIDTSDARYADEAGLALSVEAPLHLSSSASPVIRGTHDGNEGELGTASAGVYGLNSSGTEAYLARTEDGLYAIHYDGNYGYVGSYLAGVAGYNANGNTGKLGGSLRGVDGQNANGNYGGIGSSASGVYGFHNSGNYGQLGGDTRGVYGLHVNGHYGELGTSEFGVYARHNAGNEAYLGTVAFGVQGNHTSGHWGQLGTETFGVLGRDGLDGAYGYLGAQSIGVAGYSESGHNGSLGAGSAGVYGECPNLSGHAGEFRSSYASGSCRIISVQNLFSGSYDAVGVYSSCSPQDYYGYGGRFYGGYTGVIGYAGDPSSTTSGYFYGARGEASNNLGTNYGVYGYAHSGDVNWSGYFSGNCRVTGTFDNSKGQYVIDHPQNPEEEYLCHSNVSSPDMMNIYNGNVILDERGRADVYLPDYFEALNMDFRYQLTAIGGPGPGLYVADEINGNRFRIAGGEPGLKVSWMVTGIRKDAFAEANRGSAEVTKRPEEQGTYMHPELHGKPESMRLGYEDEQKHLRATQMHSQQLDANRELKFSNDQKPTVSTVGSKPEIEEPPSGLEER